MAPTNQKTNPLPCPFCGEVPTIEPWHGGAKTKRRVSCVNKRCAVGPGVCGSTRAIAIDRWNQRTPDSMVPRHLDAARSV